MTIARPSRRLFRDIPLPFVARKLAGGRQRPVTAALSLTSMIDFLIVSVVFLLLMFDPSQAASANVRVPPAVNVTEMIDAPMISVSGTTIVLDGAPVGNTRAIDESKRLVKIEELSHALIAKRETWKQVNPSKPFSGAVVLQLDQDVSSVVVKSIFQTAAAAGYPAISFMVARDTN